MNMKSLKVKSPNSGASLMALATSALLLGGCNLAAIERPHYSVTDVQSFKTAGAPDQVMMLEVFDANNTFDDAFWTSTLSNHGYPPRLRFVSDPADASDGETIKANVRVVAVVNPTQGTSRAKLCADPQTTGMDETSDRVVVRYGFCHGDKIISETRAHYNRARLADQIESNADTISYQLFPRHIRDNDDDRPCSPLLPSC